MYLQVEDDKLEDLVTTCKKRNWMIPNFVLNPSPTGPDDKVPPFYCDVFFFI